MPTDDDADDEETAGPDDRNRDLPRRRSVGGEGGPAGRRDPSQPLNYQGEPDDPPPAPPDLNTPRQPSFGNARTVGMILFLFALAVLFGASLFAYVYIRTTSPQSPPTGTIALPKVLLLSTVLVLAVSVALWVAGRQIRARRHRSYRNSLTAALALGAGFLTVQAPALGKLLFDHNATAKFGGTRLYGLIFVLILLHALHVVGGMVALAWVTFRAHRGAYERAGGHDPIRNTALYWHFLDAVWIVMFGVLYLSR